MAKNYVQDGTTLDLIAPAGGVESGGAYTIGTIAVVSLVKAAAGEVFTGKPVGVFSLPCAAGLKEGAAVSLKAGALVAAGTADSTPFGKLVADEAGGFAPCLLSN